jgi:hypothetical protein
MAVLDNRKPYLKYILKASLQHHAPREDITYPVISEFISEHKIPLDRFVIYPQISLRWKPDNLADLRAEVPDFGLGNFTLKEPYFKIRVGAEAKRIMEQIMASLPAPETIQGNAEVMGAFHVLYYQGEDQAKAAIKGKMTFSNTLPFLLFVGPYWVHVRYGPFSEAQLTVRTHKPSPSADWVEANKAMRRLKAAPVERRLFLLGTADSAAELEKIIAATDSVAQALRNEAARYKCMSIY